MLSKTDSGFTALCEFLVKKLPIRTIILFGSTARGDATDRSDIDLLLITQQKINKRDAKKIIPHPLIPNKNLNLAVYSAEQIESAYSSGSLFMFHLLREGKILYDNGFFARLSSDPFIISCSRMRLSLKIFEQRLETSNNLEIYNNHFVRLFSDFYSMAKNIAFILLANEGDFIFNRKRAFIMLSEKYPNYKRKIKKLQGLEPFYIKTHRGTSIRYPFKPTSVEKVKEMKRYLKELIRLGEIEVVC